MKCATCNGRGWVWKAGAGNVAAKEICTACRGSQQQQLTLDVAQGEELKREGIDRSRAASPRFQRAALAVVREVAGVYEEFTSDEVRVVCEHRGIRAREPRALGAVFRLAAADGICESTDSTRESEWPANHRRPVRVWRSLIFNLADSFDDAVADDGVRAMLREARA